MGVGREDAIDGSRGHIPTVGSARTAHYAMGARPRVHEALVPLARVQNPAVLGKRLADGEGGIGTRHSNRGRP